MSEGSTAAASSGGDDKGNGIWNLLPSFDPATDNAKEYMDKVKFLQGICPQGQKNMLEKISPIEIKKLGRSKSTAS